MSKITVELTEDQAKSCLYALMDFLQKESPDIPQSYVDDYKGFLKRLIKKFSTALSEI